MTSEIIEKVRLVHFFHRPALREFQKTLIQTISLPIGARGQFHYGKVWPSDSFINEIDNINSSKGYRGLVWAVDCLERQAGERKELEFGFAVPIRLITVLHVSADEDNYYISYRAEQYVSQFIKMDRQSLRDYSRILFDDDKIAYPGSEKGFIHLGDLPEISSSNDFSFSALHSALKDIQSTTTSQGKEPEIKVYPLVRLDNIKGQEPNDEGIYELSVDKRYVLSYTAWQDDKYRSRAIMINNMQNVGRPIVGEICEKIQEGQSQIDFEIDFNDIKVLIPIFMQAKRSWYKFRFAPLISLCVLSIVAFLLFSNLNIATSATSKSKSSLLTALIVLVLQKLFETFQKT